MEEKMIYKAMASILQQSVAIGKDRKNQMQRYNFRGVDDAYNSLHEIFAQNSVFNTPEVLEERSEERTTKNGGVLIYRILKIKFTFWAVDGSSVSAIMMGESMDSGDKASNKAMSVAHKYALLQIFLIPTEEPKDPENESPEPQHKAPQIDYIQERTKIMAQGNNIVMQMDEGSRERYKKRTHELKDLLDLKKYIDLIVDTNIVPELKEGQK